MNQVLEKAANDRFDVSDVGELLCSRASTYYPAEGPDAAWEADLIHEQRRSNSEVYEFRLRGPCVERRVIVKVPFTPRMFSSATRVEGRDRPRVSPAPDPTLKGQHEYAALHSIYDHFSKLGDPSFGVIRPLDLLPPRHIMVMEKGPDKNLSYYVRLANRVQGRFLRFPLPAALRLSGRWLREFHQLNPLGHCSDRTLLREDFTADCSRFWQYLVGPKGRDNSVSQLERRFSSACGRHLPEKFPIGVTHGDYAPRNILLVPDCVTGFDTQARWRAPIYEDIAHFLVALNASGPQVSSRGLLYSQRTIRELESAFLAGYFEQQEVPLAAIRLFECQRLLEWWTSLTFRYRHSSGLRKYAKWSRAVLWQPYLKSYLERALRDIEQID